LASQSEGLLAFALFQKVMINLNPMAMGINFQRGLFVLAGLSCVGRFVMGLYNDYFQNPCNLQLHRDKPRALK
jgi:hypothetical protein